MGKREKGERKGTKGTAPLSQIPASAPGGRTKTAVYTYERRALVFDDADVVDSLRESRRIVVDIVDHDRQPKNRFAHWLPTVATRHHQPQLGPALAVNRGRSHQAHLVVVVGY